MELVSFGSHSKARRRVLGLATVQGADPNWETEDSGTSETACLLVARRLSINASKSVDQIDYILPFVLLTDDEDDPFGKRPRLAIAVLDPVPRADPFRHRRLEVNVKDRAEVHKMEHE